MINQSIILFVKPPVAPALTLIFQSGNRYELASSQYSAAEESPLAKALGPGERWITVHPNGEGSKGVPVMIRENPDGSAHVIGGAGGKLNYLKLKGVKSPEHYRKEVAENRKAKAEAKKQQIAREKELGTHQPKQQAREGVKAQQREHEREFIKTVAEAMGWEGHEFDPNPYLNLSDAAQQKAVDQHHRGWLKKAKEAVKVQRDRLLADADARADALGEVPLEATAADTLSVNDLDPIKPQTGLGYSLSLKAEAEKRGATEESIQKEKQASTGKEPKPKTGKSVAEQVAKELEEVREPGPLGIKPKLVDAQQAVALLKAEKNLKAIQKQAREANQSIDNDVEPKGAYVLEAEPAKDEDVAADLENDLRTIATRNFLTEAAKQGDIGRHVGVGAYNAINAVSQASAGSGIMDRQTVDVLGVAGAAQVLAQRLHADLSSEQLEDLIAGMEDYHVDHYMAATEKAVGEAQSWQKVAEDIELDAADDGHDLARMQELNRKRIDAIDHANRLLGTTLGEMEANAAVLVALKQGAKDKIELAMGEMSLDKAIVSARAIGLDRGEYQINSVGGQRFLTIGAEGMAKLARPVNRDDLKMVRDNLDIIEGRHDDDEWLPSGIANRPDLAMRAEIGVAPRLAEPFSPGPDMEQSVRDYIGGRAADGDAPADIVADLLSQDMLDKAGDREAYLSAVDKLAPLKGEDGKMIRAESHQAAFEAMADAFVADRGGDRTPLHRQTFATDQTAVDALHRALSSEPAGTLAYKPVGDLSAKDQGALRNWWWDNLGHKDEKAAGLRAELAKMEQSEPEKEIEDMFGRAENPAWRQWKQDRDAKAEELNSAGLNWAKYASTMGGPAKAYAAVQDLVRGKVAKEFHGAYNTLNPKYPIKLGRTIISGNLNHLDAVDPDARERRITEQREMVDSLRERVAGRYASGAVSDKMDALREQKAGFEQSQMGFFAAEPEPEKETPLSIDQRHTLGHAAEQKIAGMMSVVGKNFKPGQPTKLWQASMNGRYVNQQRAIKLLDKNRRLVLAQGVGSGKSIIGLGGFTHLHAQGKAKRGIFVVPSIVQDQFNGEALRYLEPGKYQWHNNPGASREERIAAYKDPSNHFSVVTHQSFRDDMLHLGAQQAGIDESAMAEKINGMSRAERKSWMRGVMDATGMDHDYLMVDEGHDLLNRAGKENSMLSNVVDSVSDNVPNYVNASADPAKNDPSEIFSLLQKMDPDRYTDAKAFMRKYGVDTPSSKDELRRELARYFYPGRIESGVKAAKKVETVKLTAEQHAAIKAAEKHVASARLARMRGKVDVEAMKALSPSSFEGVPDARHESVAKRLQQNLGILKDAAYKKAINEHENGAKLDAVARIAKDRAGKPGIVFAHSLEAVKRIADRLKAEGHRVVMLTGADSAKEKGRKKLAFNPEKGEATADIMVASDAGAVGMNAQRGRWLVQADTPDTAKTWNQRNGRIDRLGQKNETELIDLVADHPSERRARDRLMKKDDLRGILTTPLEGLDDTGLASYLNKARMEREQGGLF